MGQCGGKIEKEQEINKVLTKRIKKERKENPLKLLFLGAGDSGKSTFCKQLRNIHHNGYPAHERQKYIYILRLNALSNMQIICMEIQSGKYELADETNEKIDALMECSVMDTNFEEIGTVIQDLYDNEPLVKTVLKEKSIELSISQMAKFYFTNLDRFFNPEYIPTDDDIVRAKIKTSGIITTEFSVGGYNFKLVDVGGQRSERRKWISCFDDVTTVVFLAALDGYDLVLYEDSSANRLEESLRIFEGIVNEESFTNIPIMLFLNKVDLFEEKYRRSPLHRAFKGEISKSDAKDFEYCKKFIAKKFEDIRGETTLYTHFTCALDQDNCQRVFEICRDIIVAGSLDSAGF
eukprot:TRINITY_DN437_c0_g2_i1.p1 TRINITY_DN437_c0_g2~~TRINITY_DN437_c0_g2_i1.p1  ORF type:complete len:349 (-),score=74.40 TRINITY_DN437_c0_g2_i1:38-1084(-)